MAVFTKNKAELLKLFFTNPEKSFYMQEIGRILGIKPGVFQRTLNNMATEGILESEYRANARYFRINKRYPLYRELKNLVSKSAGVQENIQEALRGLKNIQLAFIYGSFAKDKAHAVSDIDLIIVGKPDENVLIAGLDQLEHRLQREINYNLYSPEKFKSDIKGKNPFLREVLNNKKIMLIGSPDGLREICKK